MSNISTFYANTNSPFNIYFYFVKINFLTDLISQNKVFYSSYYKEVCLPVKKIDFLKPCSANLA